MNYTKSFMSVVYVSEVNFVRERLYYYEATLVSIKKFFNNSSMHYFRRAYAETSKGHCIDCSNI